MKDIDDILEVVQLIPQFKPIVDLAMTGLEAYSDNFETLKDFVVDNTVEIRSRIYKGFLAEGIGEQAALALTIAAISDFKSAAKSKLNK